MATSKTLGQRVLGALGIAARRDMEEVWEQAEQSRREVEEANARAKRAYEAGYNDANDDPADAALGLAKGGFGYKRGAGGGREGGVSFADNLSTGWDLWQSNGVIQRDAKITRDYAVGGQITIQAPDPALEEILTDFWKTNALDRHVGEFALQLGVLGTQCFPAFVRKTDGRVLLGYLDPIEIEQVVPDPDNGLNMAAVVCKERVQTQPWEMPENSKRVYRVLRPDVDTGKIETAAQAKRAPWEAELLKNYGLKKYTGDCFFVKTNSFCNQPTGYSDAIAAADMSDQWDQTSFAIGERELFADYFSFDVTMNNADSQAISDRAQQLGKNPPKRGSVLVHNDEESWQMFAPDLKQPASIATLQEQRRIIIGTLGKPEAWFGNATGASLSTIQAQGDPTWRGLAYRQGEIKNMLMDFLTFARDQAIIAGYYLPVPDADTSFDLVMPEMTATDLTAVSGALANITSALALEVDRGWLTDEQAQQVILKFMAEFGMKLTAAPIPTEAPATETAARWQDFFNTQAVVTDGGENV